MASVAVAYLLHSRRKTPDQLERERRDRISSVGRITDGTVLDIQQLSNNGHGLREMILYQYDVAGVSYEAAQDITTMNGLFDVRSCKIGLPASIKYDPHNPGNSIVLAEKWKGLRQ